MNRISAVALLLLLSAGCETANNQHPTVQYEEKKKSMKEAESDSPLKFLKANIQYSMMPL